MTFHRIATLLAVAAICTPSLPALAQKLDEPPAKPRSVPRTAHTRAPRKPAKSAPAPAGAGPSLLLEPDHADAGEDRASSLERRRKAFFAPKPDQDGAAPDRATPSAGVTLGGSNGLTPGMGFSF